MSGTNGEIFNPYAPIPSASGSETPSYKLFRALGYIHPHQFEGLNPFQLKTRFHHLSFFEFIGAISSTYFSLQGSESNIPPERKAKLPSRSSWKVPNGNGYVFRKAIIFGNSSFYMFYAVPGTYINMFFDFLYVRYVSTMSPGNLWLKLEDEISFWGPGYLSFRESTSPRVFFWQIFF